jgi:hypothetical protein
LNFGGREENGIRRFLRLDATAVGGEEPPLPFNGLRTNGRQAVRRDAEPGPASNHAREAMPLVVWISSIELRLGQASSASQEPFGSKKQHQDQERARRMTQMQGAFLNNFIVQVAL